MIRRFKRWLAWLFGWDLCDFCSSGLDEKHSEIWFSVNDCKEHQKMRICSRCWSVFQAMNSKSKDDLDKMKDEFDD